jgi:hypothetical protein
MLWSTNSPCVGGIEYLHRTPARISSYMMTYKINYLDNVTFQVYYGGGYEECRLLRCDAVWLL